MTAFRAEYRLARRVRAASPLGKNTRCARSAHDMQRGRSRSKRSQRPRPSSSPHSEQTESRRISKTTMSAVFGACESDMHYNFERKDELVGGLARVSSRANS